MEYITSIMTKGLVTNGGIDRKMATTVYQRKIGDADQGSDGRSFSIEHLY